MNLSDSWTAGQRIERVSAAEAVFGSLRKAIEDGQLPIGTRLSSEAVLAQQYGVSRSVVREALRSCASLGLTETRTGRGTFVIADRVGGDLALGQYSARELTEARPHIEVPAAGLAARRRSEDELQLLRDIVAAMDREEDPQAWVALDAAFHAAIARTSGNRVFEKVVADIRDAMAKQSGTLNMVAGRKEDSDAEHREILTAIEAGSPDQACEAMRRHLAAVGAALDRVLHR
ncbi:FadR/GntR family transcriptional regulator [Arthrobacter sp. GCM10027362]|uniref:FadR/GntR family transcriptional regulator n=1 Tax=Arthrobacter sp. GCM10027362 TaxID=3273379 RepID=UPI00363C79AC